MKLLYSSRVGSIDLNIFHFKPQARTFSQFDRGNILYYRINLPNLYIITSFKKMINDYFRHSSLHFFGSINRITSTNDNVFVVPLPNTTSYGAMCVSRNLIHAPTSDELHQKVFDAFFQNIGGEADPIVGLETIINPQYMQEFPNDSWNKLLQHTGKPFYERMIGCLQNHYKVNELNEILKRHAQEV